MAGINLLQHAGRRGRAGRGRFGRPPVLQQEAILLQRGLVKSVAKPLLQRFQESHGNQGDRDERELSVRIIASIQMRKPPGGHLGQFRIGAMGAALP
jgi:hypothetical protein